MLFTVYILLCADGSYYTGLTRRPPEQRLWEHNDGTVPGYTQSRRPVSLLHVEAFGSALEAIARERQIKRWSRAKKAALVDGQFERLSDLSQSSKKPD